MEFKFPERPAIGAEPRESSESPWIGSVGAAFAIDAISMLEEDDWMLGVHVSAGSRCPMAASSASVEPSVCRTKMGMGVD